MDPQNAGEQWQAGGLQGPAWGGGPVMRSWRASLAFGALTLILGLVVVFRPSGSLNVIAVLLGILLVISGLFHLVRVFDTAEPHRVMLGISGLLFAAAGIVVISHYHLTLALIGLIIGISWAVQGIVILASAISGGSGAGRSWAVFFGLISLAGGVVAIASPIPSVTVLAVLMGIWFIILGVAEVAGAFILRSHPVFPPPAGRGDG